MANQEHLDLLRQGVKIWNEWRDKHPQIYIDFLQADLTEIDLSGVNLSEADLNGANLSRSNFIGADLHGALLRKANFIGANLNRANLRETILFGATFVEADLIEADLTRAHLTSAIITGANLSRADLTSAKLTGADLTRANSYRTQFSKANLSRAKALGTNFAEAIFTGACLENWNINSETNLDKVNCDYIYLKENQQERRPHDPNKNFAPGEFTKLFQKVLETVDLIFKDGIEWQAFLASFQKLQVECGGSELAIQAIERKSGGAFVVRVEVPADANKAEVEQYLKREYEIQLKAIEKKYRLQLNAKDEQIEIYKQNSANIMKMAELVAKVSNPTIVNVEAKAVAESESKGNTYNQSGNFGIGHMSGGEIKEGAKVAGVINEAQPKNLAEVAAEIQDLLNYFEQNNPTIIEAQRMVKTATERQPELKNAKMIEEAIEATPTLKQRLRAAGEAAYVETVKMLLPPVGVAIEAVKAWNNPE